MKGNNSGRAKQRITYYFRLLAAHQGVHWDSDNDQEVAEIIDNLMDEVDERIANAIENLAHNLTD